MPTTLMTLARARGLALLAVWLFSSPWLLNYAGIPTLAWNDWITSTVIFGLAIAIFFSAKTSALANRISSILAIIGIWLAISPWIFGYSHTIAPGLNHLIVGALVIAATSWGLQINHAYVRHNYYIVLLPWFSVIIMMITTMYSISIARDCPKPPYFQNENDVFTTVLEPFDKEDLNTNKGTPFLCKTDYWWPLIKAAFQESYLSYHDVGIVKSSVPIETLNPEDQNNFIHIRRQNQLARLHILHDRIKNHIFTMQSQDNPSNYEEQLRINEEKLRIFSSMIEEQETKWASSIIAAGQEATARIRWIIAFSLQFWTVLAIIAVSVVIICKTISNVDEKYYISLIFMILFLFLLVLPLSLSWGILEYTIKYMFGVVLLPVETFDPLPWFVNNNLFEYTQSRLMPGIESILESNYLFLLGAGVTLTVAVGINLVERPDDVNMRAEKDRPSQAQAKKYELYLVRCYDRLQFAMYAGAATLLVGVFHVNALNGWPISLIATEQTEMSRVHHVMTKVVGQITFGWGVVFSMFLVALFVPAILVIRHRAWQFARTYNPGKTYKEQFEWLTARRLSVSRFARITQLLALLAPAIGGSFVNFLDSLWLGS